jgi:hypothetical protein
MNQKLSQLFKNTEDLGPSAGLEVFILAKIEVLAAKRTRRKLIFSYAGLLVSIAAGVCAVAVFGSGLIESEFWKLILLAFSDLSVVLANWKDFAYSLMETIPVVHVAVILTPVFAIFWLLSFYTSAKSAMKNSHDFRGYIHIGMAE